MARGGCDSNGFEATRPTAIGKRCFPQWSKQVASCGNLGLVGLPASSTCRESVMKSQSAFGLALGATGRVFTSIGDGSTAVAHAVAARWRDHLARRREARESGIVAEMSPYMLKDIGAPSWMISRAVGSATAGAAAAVRLPVSILAAALVLLPASPGSAWE